jgi:hypothetical protein
MMTCLSSVHTFHALDLTLWSGRDTAPSILFESSPRPHCTLAFITELVTRSGLPCQPTGIWVMDACMCPLTLARELPCRSLSVTQPIHALRIHGHLGDGCVHVPTDSSRSLNPCMHILPTNRTAM